MSKINLCFINDILASTPRFNVNISDYNLNTCVSFSENKNRYGFFKCYILSKLQQANLQNYFSQPLQQWDHHVQH